MLAAGQDVSCIDMREAPRWRYVGAGLTDAIHVRLFCAHARPIGPDWATRDVLSSYWRLYRNDRDGAALELADGLHPLTAGRLHLVPAGVRFSCRATTTVGHFYLHGDVVGLSEVFRRELCGRPVTLPEAPELEAEAVRLAARVASEPTPDLALHCRLKALFFGALAAWLEALPAERVDRVARLTAARAAVGPALEWIDTHLAEPLDNRQLAALCCVGEDHFIRLFRRLVGQTPARYIRDRRLTLAAQELLFTEKTIDAVAAGCGFGSRTYFSRAFAAQTGLPPGAYRRLRPV